MNTKTNESANVQENAQVIYDVTITSACISRRNCDDITDVEYRILERSITIGECTKHNSIAYCNDCSKRYTLMLFFDKTVPGYILDDDGMTVKADVTNIDILPSSLAKLLINADARLALLINSETRVSLLKKIITGARISMGRRLVTNEYGDEFYQTTFEAITFSEISDKVITNAFTQKMAECFNV